MDHRRSGDDRGRMRIDFCDPAQRAGSAIDRHHVSAVTALVVAENQLVPDNRWTDPRQASCPAVVIGYLPGPEELSIVGTDRVQVSRPIGKIHRIPRDRWSG